MATLTTNKLQQEAGRSVSTLHGACGREEAPTGTFLENKRLPLPRPRSLQVKEVSG